MPDAVVCLAFIFDYIQDVLVKNSLIQTFIQVICFSSNGFEQDKTPDSFASANCFNYFFLQLHVHVTYFTKEMIRNKSSFCLQRVMFKSIQLVPANYNFSGNRN